MKHEKIDAAGGEKVMHTQNRTTPRKRALLVMACAVAGLVILAGAASAGAAIKFIWKVNGSPLADGKTIKLKYLSGKGKITFEDPRFTVVCNGLEGESPLISENSRGTHEESSLKFKECNVTSPAEACKVEKEEITFGPMRGEIIEGVDKSKGKALLEFEVLKSPFQVTVTIERPKNDKCKPLGAALSKKFLYGRRFLAEALKQEKEFITQTFKFEPEEPHNLITYAGVPYSAGLKEGCYFLQVKGEIATELATSQTFGPY